MLNIFMKPVFACFLFLLSANATALPTVDISTNDSGVSEAGPTSATFTISRSGEDDISQALTVFYRAEGTASWAENQSLGDYILSPYGLQARPNLINVSIPANQRSVNVTLTANRDNDIEGTETATLRLEATNNYMLGNETEVHIDITDDVAVISISSTDTVATEAGPTTANFTISRTGQGDTSQPMTVYYRAEGTATWTENQSNSDYIVSPGGLQGRPDLLNVTIPANQLSVTVILTPNLDDIEEGDEEAVLTLQDRDVYTLGSPNIQRITIVDFREMIFKDSFE
jgi:hypothetical protein